LLRNRILDNSITINQHWSYTFISIGPAYIRMSISFVDKLLSNARSTIFLIPCAVKIVGNGSLPIWVGGKSFT